MKKIMITAFIFMIFGLIWAIFNGFSCKGLCNNCSSEQLAPCSFLFLFIGIIFFVCGLSIIWTWKKS